MGSGHDTWQRVVYVSSNHNVGVLVQPPDHPGARRGRPPGPARPRGCYWLQPHCMKPQVRWVTRCPRRGPHELPVPTEGRPWRQSSEALSRARWAAIPGCRGAGSLGRASPRASGGGGPNCDILRPRLVNAIPPISVRSLPGMRTMPRRTLTGRRDAKPIEHEEDHIVAAAGQLEA